MVDAAAQIVQKASKPFLGIFSRYLKWKVMFIWIGILIIYAVVISISSANPDIGLTFIGERLLTPTIAVDLQLQDIIINQGVYSPTPLFFGGLWNAIFIYLTLFFSFYTMWIWIAVLSKFVSWSPFSNSSETFKNYGLAIIAFLLIQLLFLAWHDKGSLMTPIMMFVHLYQASPYLLTELVRVGDSSLNTTEMSNMTGIAQDITNITA